MVTDFDYLEKKLPIFDLENLKVRYITHNVIIFVYKADVFIYFVLIYKYKEHSELSLL